MRSTVYRAVAFVMYQFSLLAGIALFPMAVLMRQVGITLPVHRMVSRAGDVYDRVASETA